MKREKINFCCVLNFLIAKIVSYIVKYILQFFCYWIWIELPLSTSYLSIYLSVYGNINYRQGKLRHLTAFYDGAFYEIWQIYFKCISNQKFPVIKSLHISRLGTITHYFFLFFNTINQLEEWYFDEHPISVGSFGFP